MRLVSSNPSPTPPTEPLAAVGDGDGRFLFTIALLAVVALVSLGIAIGWLIVGDR